MNIVTFEDNEIYALIIQKQIGADLGNTVQNYTKGEVFLSKSYEKIDLFIIDYELDEMNGMELFNQLKDQYMDSKFVVLSNNPDSKIEEYFVNNGVLAFLEKKFIQPERIKEIIKSIMMESGSSGN